MKQTYRKIMLLMAVLPAVTALLGGCGQAAGSSGAAPAPQVDRNAARFEGSSAGSLTQVESSLLLSEKYAAIAVESEKIRQENKRLIDENVALNKQNAELKAQLEQALKELKEANTMLVDMRVEINNWKNNVLGFRDEMRASQKAQLEALLKIMQLLGGEAPANTVSATVDNTDPNQKK